MKFTFKKNQSNGVKLVEGCKSVFESAMISEDVLELINNSGDAFDVAVRDNNRGFCTIDENNDIVPMHVVKKADGIAFYAWNEDTEEYVRVYVEDGDFLYDSFSEAVVVVSEKMVVNQKKLELAAKINGILAALHRSLNDLHNLVDDEDEFAAIVSALCVKNNVDEEFFTEG